MVSWILYLSLSSFKVLECSIRYWKVSSCTVCLLEVLVSKVSSDPFLLLLFCGFKVCQMVSLGSLCLSKFWVSEHCFGFFGLVCQRFQGLNVGGFLRVCFLGLRGLGIK